MAVLVVRSTQGPSERGASGRRPTADGTGGGGAAPGVRVDGSRVAPPRTAAGLAAGGNAPRLAHPRGGDRAVPGRGRAGRPRAAARPGHDDRRAEYLAGVVA